MKATAFGLFTSSHPMDHDVIEKRLNASQHLPALDGIRGLAILLVLLFHTFPASSLPIIGTHLNKLVLSMWLGVDLFFVISGFLITRILLNLKDSPKRLRVFYGRRIVRIFPLYFLVLTLSLWILPIVTLRDVWKLQPLWLWFYSYGFNIWILLHNSWPPANVLNHFWSLAVEEQFYLFWPFIIFTPVGKICQQLPSLFAVSQSYQRSD